MNGCFMQQEYAWTLGFTLQFSCETEGKSGIFENLNRWNDNNKIHVKENVNVNWIKLAKEKL
jgi:hypothetical protein